MRIQNLLYVFYLLSDLGQDKLCLTVIEWHDEKWERFMLVSWKGCDFRAILGDSVYKERNIE